MYRRLFTLLAAVAVAAAACAQSGTNMKEKEFRPKTLVAYFSATGTTARAAERLAAATGGDLHAIAPVRPYTDTDLDWHDRRSRSSVEMNDSDARPAIRDGKIRMADYDVVFIGYPVWWDLAPRIVDTFLESHDLKGKMVVPFATSGGSAIAGSAAALRKGHPGPDWREGRLLNRTDEGALRGWLDALELGY